MKAPPTTEAALLERAWAIAGRTVADVAAEDARVVPDLRRHKGFIGELVERALGAVAGNLAVPDFPALGVELKTLPMRDDGRAVESTFVTTVPMGSLLAPWEESRVQHKLARVLWIPVVGEQRVFGAPLLWSPSEDELAVLASDWRLFGEAVALGETWRINARIGEAIQLRPKGASAASTAWVVGEDAEWVQDMRRGVYLRARFTTAIFQARRRSAR